MYLPALEDGDDTSEVGPQSVMTMTAPSKPGERWQLTMCSLGYVDFSMEV